MGNAQQSARVVDARVGVVGALVADVDPREQLAQCLTASELTLYGEHSTLCLHLPVSWSRSSMLRGCAMSTAALPSGR